MVKFPYREGHKAEYEPENAALELKLTIITTIGVIALLAPGLYAWKLYVELPTDALEVEGVGQQWVWSYRFPGEDGVYGNTRGRLFSSKNTFGLDPDDPYGQDDSAYPAAPDSEYGWEKLFSERLYKAFERNHGLNVRIARFHNIFGIEGTWDGGREKAPAAMCRKAIMTDDGGKMEVWGDGSQTRSFLYIDECIEAVRRLMNSDYSEPLNIGSEEMISINDFAKMAIDISGKNISIHNIFGKEFEEKYGHPTPVGVKGRNSDNKLFQEKIGWSPSQKLIIGMEKTYHWIAKQVLALAND